MVLQLLGAHVVVHDGPVARVDEASRAQVAHVRAHKRIERVIVERFYTRRGEACGEKHMRTVQPATCTEPSRTKILRTVPCAVFSKSTRFESGTIGSRIPWKRAADA